MKYLIGISGPVASGKSVLVKEFERRFKTNRISTRQLLVDNGVENERSALIEAGKTFDRETDGAWIRSALGSYESQFSDYDVVIIDAVRTARQIEHLREHYGERFIHIHVAVPYEVAKQRYESRASDGDTLPYARIRADPTESSVWDLDAIADRVVENINCDPASLLARVTAGLMLFPRAPERLVDVIVGGQYGSEGKGHICSYLSTDYDVLVRVGGPNAGHKAAYPKQKYVQLPSGTRGNTRAMILIGAGATIWPPQILQEIKECGVTCDRLVIDEQAMIIEQSDRDVEAKLLQGIASTVQGVGAATARKIMGRGTAPPFGQPVRLAKDHPDLKPYLGSVAKELEDAYTAGKRIMLEGTQGTSLSLHHASYPHVTSRETTASGCLADAGISPRRVRRVIMVARTYPIRVGGTSGPMNNMIDAKIISERSNVPLAEIEKTEVGTVSGRPRRIAEFDWEQLRCSSVLNGVTDIALTFSDYLTIRNREAKRFDQLSPETKKFIAEVEHVANAPVSLISTRFHRFGIIDRRSWK